MFPITSNIWATSGEPIPGQGAAFLEKTHHLFDSFYSLIFSFILLLFLAPNPNTHWAPYSKPPMQPLLTPGPGLYLVWLSQYTAQENANLGSLRDPH